MCHSWLKKWAQAEALPTAGAFILFVLQILAQYPAWEITLPYSLKVGIYSFFFYSVTHFHEAGNSVIIAETSFVPLTWNWPLGSKVTRDGKIQTDTECTFISLFSTKTKFKKKKYGMCIVMRAEKDCIDCSIWFAEHTRSAAACSQCYGWKHKTKSFFLS